MLVLTDLNLVPFRILERAAGDASRDLHPVALFRVENQNIVPDGFSVYLTGRLSVVTLRNATKLTKVLLSFFRQVGCHYSRIPLLMAIVGLLCL